MQVITPKEYAASKGWTSQNVTKKIRLYNKMVDCEKKKKYLTKALPGIGKIENIHIRCVLLFKDKKK